MKTSHGIYCDTDLLTWIGGKAYETVDAFVREAQQQGCSRRLPGMMNWITPGKTRVFLVHKNNIKDEAFSSLFGFYTINSIHHIFDDVGWGRKMPFEAYHPTLIKGRKPPGDIEEFEEYIVKHKIDIVRRKAAKKDPFAELLGELWKKWLKYAIKRVITQDGVRRIPLSVEADNLERLCGGASSLSSGRYPGAYASDEIGDKILDQILDWLMDESELPDEYFWEEDTEEGIVVRKRRKHKKAPQGISRSGRISLNEIYRRYSKPSSRLSGIVVFDKPYPLYYHPPKPAYRSFQRIDGNSLLLKVNLPQYIMPDICKEMDQYS